MKQKMALVYCLLACLILSGAAEAKQTNSPVYKDPGQPIEERIKDLISRMTVEEKVWQLSQYPVGINDNDNNIIDVVKNIPAELGAILYLNTTPAVRNRIQRRAMEESRLGIPMIFGYDVIHGFRTIYPISLAQACSWNPTLVSQACAIAAQEARMSGVDWTFSPMIDVSRDGRWGRVAEGYGEDPYTNAIFTVASVRGYQGDNMADGHQIAACLKHYVGYGASEGGRDYVYTEISPQTLWDTYMPPYEAGVKAGAATLMSCFNNVSGIPGTGNRYLLTDILKKRWGHDGFVVSDWAAITQLVPQGYASDKKDATLKAFNAGVELDLGNSCYDSHLLELINEGKISMQRLNDAVARILRIKFRLGLFENPYIPVTTDEERFMLPTSLATAERLAEESMVLLKNEGEILPLQDAARIAVVGPMAREKWDLLGSWPGHGSGEHVVSIYEGLEKEFADKAELLYARGCDFENGDTSGYAEAVARASEADIVLVCLGEKRQWSGENASRSSLALPSVQEELVSELAKTGKPIVLILSNGRPLELRRLEPACQAIVEMWQPGLRGGNALAGILSGRVNPSGKLAMTFPYSTGQIPIYYNRRPSARPNQGQYQDIPAEPLYAFGHGLSYTEFTYSEPTIPTGRHAVKRTEKLTVEIEVSNTGSRDGYETVHWFIMDPVCSVTRPVKELKYFDKQLIRTGETKTFRFEIDPLRDLSFVDGQGNQFLESGDYYVKVKDKQLKIEITD
nr:glycoside hydrolase family 3 N-terminal domain-containing protein [Alistipes onderdonkii]